MKSFKNGIVSGRRCSNNATTSSLKVSLGPTQNLTARVLYGKMMNTIKRVWRVITMIGRKKHGSVQEKFGQTTNYSAVVLTLLTSNKVESAIATSFRPWHRLLRSPIECARYSTTKKQTMLAATCSSFTSTVFPRELWSMIFF